MPRPAEGPGRRPSFLPCSPRRFSRLRWPRPMTLSSGTWPSSTGPSFSVLAPAPAVKIVSVLNVVASVDSGDSTSATGEAVRPFVQASKGSFSTPLNIDSSGNVVLRFPDSALPCARIKPDEVAQSLGSESFIRKGGPADAKLIKMVASTRSAPPLEAAVPTVAGLIWDSERRLLLCRGWPERGHGRWLQPRAGSLPQGRPHSFEPPPAGAVSTVPALDPAACSLSTGGLPLSPDEQHDRLVRPVLGFVSSHVPVA